MTTPKVQAFSLTRMAPGTCLKKPLSAAGFAKVIADVTAPRHQLIATFTKLSLPINYPLAD
jgi:hypothetical protein